MADYYTATNDPADNTDAEPDVLRDEHASIAAGFVKIAAYTGNGGKLVAINAGGTAQEAITTTGTGNGVRATSPTLVTPNLGTPSALVGTNITGTAAGLTAGLVTNGVYTTDEGTVFLAPDGSAASLTSFPTLNQNTTGTAAGLSVTLVPSKGGTGIANNDASTVTISGSYAITLTVTGITGITLPETGTLASLGVAQTWTKAQRGAYVALTSTTNSIAVDLALSNNFNHTLTENTTLAAPTNVVAGQSGVVEFTQHASAAKTVAWNSFWRWAGGSDGTISATTSAVSVLCYVVDSTGTFATCTLQVAVAA